jgi:hypothetical protein
MRNIRKMMATGKISDSVFDRFKASKAVEDQSLAGILRKELDKPQQQQRTPPNGYQRK